MVENSSPAWQQYHPFTRRRSHLWPSADVAAWDLTHMLDHLAAVPSRVRQRLHYCDDDQAPCKLDAAIMVLRAACCAAPSARGGSFLLFPAAERRTLALTSILESVPPFYCSGGTTKRRGLDVPSQASSIIFRGRCSPRALEHRRCNNPAGECRRRDAAAAVRRGFPQPSQLSNHGSAPFALSEACAERHMLT